MRLPNFAEWLTIVANLAVVAGIAFLALELRQTNDLMESERRFNRLQISMAGNASFFENPLLNEAFRKARSGLELNENEEIALRFQMANVFTVWQWTWIELYGTNEYPLSQYREAMRSDTAIRESWESRKSVLMPEFVTFVEKNIIQ